MPSPNSPRSWQAQDVGSGSSVGKLGRSVVAIMTLTLSGVEKNSTGIQRGWLWIPVCLSRSTRGVRHRGAEERLATRVTCPWVSFLAILEISSSLADFRSSRPLELPADQYCERK